MRDTQHTDPNSGNSELVRILLTNLVRNIHAWPHLQIHNIRHCVIEYARIHDIHIDTAGERRDSHIWIELSDGAGCCYTLIVPAPTHLPHETDGW